MKAIVIHEYGGVDKLKYEDVPTPEVGVGEVLIQVKTAAINHFDHDIREGVSGVQQALPHVLGVEGAGVIAEVGEGVTALKPGDRVAPMFAQRPLSCPQKICICQRGYDNICLEWDRLGVSRWGTYAEYVKSAQHNTLRLPDGLSFDVAAAVQITLGTSWQMIASFTKVVPGEDVLVNAAGSGVGTAAIQIAKLHGARVIASAGSDDKLEKARELGADEVINYNRQSIRDEVARLTDGRGVDVVIESVGGDVLSQSIDALAHTGRLATCGAHAGEHIDLDVVTLFRKQITIYGNHSCPRYQLEDVLRLVVEGKLKATIDRAFPLSEAAEAHKVMDSRKFFGKLLLHPGA